ncbi:MAG: hypothetical protein V4772_00015 [Pseudomonadota bacterium]
MNRHQKNLSRCPKLLDHHNFKNHATAITLRWAQSTKKPGIDDLFRAFFPDVHLNRIGSRTDIIERDAATFTKRANKIDAIPMKRHSKPPPTKVQVSNGTSPWAALAREVAERPEGVVGLHIRSLVNANLKPKTDAVNALVEALATLQAKPDDDTAKKALDTAKCHWEEVCQTPLDDGLLADFAKDAAALTDRRKTMPPAIESIVADTSSLTDYGYKLGVDLSGVFGIWHRLWASISTERLFNLNEDNPPLSLELRKQFEEKLGREMSGDEWAKLVAQAHNHCDTVMVGKLKGKRP